MLTDRDYNMASNFVWNDDEVNEDRTEDDDDIMTIYDGHDSEEITENLRKYGIVAIQFE